MTEDIQTTATTIPAFPADAGARALILASTSLSEELLNTVDTLYQGFEAYRHVDNGFDALAYTIRPLAEALYATESILSSEPVRQIARHGRNEDRNIDLWVALHATLSQCQLALSHVERLLEPLNPEDENAVEQKQLANDAVATSIPQLKLYAKSIDMAVHMIEVRLSPHGVKVKKRPINTEIVIDQLRTLMDTQVSMLRELARNPNTKDNFEQHVLQEYTRSMGWAAETLFLATSGTRRDSSIGICRHAKHMHDDSSESRPITPISLENATAHARLADNDLIISNATEYVTLPTETSIPDLANPEYFSDEDDHEKDELEPEPGLAECPPPPCIVLEPELLPSHLDDREPLPQIKLCNDSERYYYDETLRLAGYDVRSRQFDATAAMRKLIERCRKQCAIPDEDMVGMIKVLLDVGADPREKVPSVWKYFQKLQPIGWRPKQECDFLTLSVVEGWDNIAAVFIDRGMPLDVTSPAPLHIATREGRIDVVDKLIAAGADSRLRTRGDVTALHIAAERGQHEIVSALLAAGAWVDDVGFWQTGTKFECTALQLAVKTKQEEVVEILLRAGADVDAKSAAGPQRSPSPLHLACQEAQINIVRLLLEYGANPNQEGVNGSKPISLIRAAAALSASRSDTKTLRKDCADIVKLLVQAGADPDEEASNTNLEGDKAWAGSKAAISNSEGTIRSRSTLAPGALRSRASAAMLRTSSPIRSASPLRKMLFHRKKRSEEIVSVVDPDDIESELDKAPNFQASFTMASRPEASYNTMVSRTEGSCSKDSGIGTSIGSRASIASFVTK